MGANQLPQPFVEPLVTENRPPVRSKAGAAIFGVLGIIGVGLLILAGAAGVLAWQDVGDSITVPQGSTVELGVGRHGIEKPAGNEARDVLVITSSGEVLELRSAPWDPAQLAFRLSEPDSVRFEGVAGDVQIGDGVNPYAALLILFAVPAFGVGIVLGLLGLFGVLLSTRRSTQ